MKSSAFDYAAPRSISDAAAALSSEGTTAAVAGGQSLVPMMSLRVAMPDLLVNISELSELKEVSESSEAIRLGALVTHADVEDGKTPDAFGGLMRQVAAGISYRAVRNYGTLGGSVALADPAADWPVCLIALRAVAQISNGNTIRSEPVSDFIRGQYTTSLAKEEVIVGFDIPKPGEPLRWGFCKVARKSGAFANSLAVATQQGRGGSVSVVLGAAGPRPYLLPATTQLVSDTAPDDALRCAVADDLKTLALELDDYLTRLHVSTVLHAIREMRAR
jgi:aerobic carbon-monoxide dehydrogenase medium subunit